MNAPATICGCLAPLFDYPEDRDRLMADAQAALSRAGVRGPVGEALAAFCEAVAASTTGQLQESYVITFDVSSATFPYLGYQLHGDTYNRTAYLMSIIDVYKHHGFQYDRRELPDHLGVVLRFIDQLETEGRTAEKRAFMHRFVREALAAMAEKVPTGTHAGWDRLIVAASEWVRAETMEENA